MQNSPTALHAGSSGNEWGHVLPALLGTVKNYARLRKEAWFVTASSSTQCPPPTSQEGMPSTTSGHTTRALQKQLPEVFILKPAHPVGPHSPADAPGKSPVR